MSPRLPLLLVALLAPASVGAAELVDVNHASAGELQTVPGIGPAIAGRIIESREKEGPFTTLDDLLRVKGIGRRTLDRLRPRLTVGDVPPGAARPPAAPKGEPEPAVAKALRPADLSAPVDINRATATELRRLPGVGKTIAQAIVDDRTKNGPFASVDDLSRVKGIGKRRLDRLRTMITASAPGGTP